MFLSYDVMKKKLHAMIMEVNSLSKERPERSNLKNQSITVEFRPLCSAINSMFFIFTNLIKKLFEPYLTSKDRLI